MSHYHLDYYKAGNVFFAPLQGCSEKVNQAILAQNRQRVAEAMNPDVLQQAIIQGTNNLCHELRWCLKRESLFRIERSLATLQGHSDHIKEYWLKVRHYQHWWWLESLAVGTYVGLQEISSDSLLSVCIGTVKAGKKVYRWGNRVDEEHQQDFLGLLESYDTFLLRVHEEFEGYIYPILDDDFLEYMEAQKNH